MRLGVQVPALLLAALLAPRARADEEAFRALAEAAPEVRAAAAERLGEVREEALRPRVLGALVAALEDPWPRVRQSAARALGRLGDRRAADALARRLDWERDETALACSLLALGTVGDERHAGKVAAVALGHPLTSVRAAAVTALGDLGGERARSAALSLLADPGLPDPSWSLRAAALLALARLARPGDHARVLAAFERGGGRGHWFARSALARFIADRHPEPLPRLRRLVLDADERVAVTAAAGFARAGHPEELRAHLAHRLERVRAAAAAAVGRVRLESAYGRLRLLARTDRSPVVRWAAALALFMAEDPAGDALVLEALYAREPAVWAQALAVLAARTGERHGRDREAWQAALERWRRER